MGITIDDIYVLGLCIGSVIVFSMGYKAGLQR